MSIIKWIIPVSLICLLSCNQSTKQIAPSGPELEHACVDKLTDVIVHDIFSPPVASRIYSYSTLAYYETIRMAYPNEPSFIIKMKGFSDLPVLKDSINADLAAVTAFMNVGEKLVFSKDSIRKAKNNILSSFESIDKKVFENSISFGEKMASVILERASKDHYKQTRSMPRYSVFQETGLWKQTPPDYADATEPHWNKISPLLMDSAAHCAIGSPHTYNIQKSSPFFKEVLEVFEISKNITPNMDTIARYWDDNPFVSEHKGHLTYATKKTTPVGHWIGITKILCQQEKADKLKTAKAYALTASAIFDGFIACWDEKFKQRTVRPITVIRETLESEWNSLLQTPPFPEYPSGHSVISAAAATVLTELFGENTPFHDTTELKYLGLERRFTSIRQAADEAGISRLYGGIHFKTGIEHGKKQGDKVGKLFLAFIR